MIYEVRQLCYTYAGASQPTLNHCNFTLQEGEILSILGPNGAGKSTLLNCLCGLMRPSSGSICLCGKPVERLNPRQVAEKVGYVQQSWETVFAYEVLDFVLMGSASGYGLFHSPGRQDEILAWNALNKLKIAHLARKPFTELSGGEQQQVAIARAIVQNPKVILFDEPTAHLDYGKQLVTLRLIRSMAADGYAVIMTTHNPDHVMLLGGWAAVLDENGTMVSGPWQEILTEPSLQDLYHADLRIEPIVKLDRVACIAPNL
ncbi:MAG: ABC transporter ATP-binding protein [Oscillospiraceae bacterium]